MKIVRRVILPSVIATPLWLLAMCIEFQGWTSWHLFDWLVGMFVTMVGLLLFGLPTASFVSRRSWSPWLKRTTLLFAGAIGGGLVSFSYDLFFAWFASASGHLYADDLTNAVLFAAYGFVPGAIVALVWTILNRDQLPNDPAAVRA